MNTANEHDALPHERNRRLWKKAKNWGRRTFNHAAAAARRKAEQHARWVQRKARQLAATARAFVNMIKNKFGGFNGVLKAFRIVFFFMAVMRQRRCHQRLKSVTDCDCSAYNYFKTIESKVGSRILAELGIDIPGDIRTIKVSLT